MIAPESATELLERALDDVLETRDRKREVPAYARSWQKEAFTSMLLAHDGMLRVLDGDRSFKGGNELWRELIRIQQLQSECAGIAPELAKRHNRALRTWWYTMIETSSRLNKAGTAGPVSIGPFGRARIVWLTAFGKTAFKR
ncbi:MAG: hypothetical protein RIE53_02865 [Rhodothermales bacterium]